MDDRRDLKYLSIGIIGVLIIRLLSFIQLILKSNEIHPTMIIYTLVLTAIIGSLILIMKEDYNNARKSYISIIILCLIGIVASYITGVFALTSSFVITGVLFSIIYKQEELMEYISKKRK